MRPALVLAIGALVGGPALAGAGEEGPRRGKVDRIEHRRSKMVLVPAGTFTMGFSATGEALTELQEACVEELGNHLENYCRMQPPHSSQLYAFADAFDARPERDVFLSAFEIDRHEVTVAEYRRCVASGGCDVAPLLAGDTRYLDEDLPMVNVTFQEAADFCAAAGKRLPTEAEWEKAARGTDGRRYPWGDHVRRDGANHGRTEDPVMALTHASGGVVGPGERVPEERDGGKYALPPGTLVWGESPYGATDMAGNVAEWVQDYYYEGLYRQGEVLRGAYEDLPVINPVRLAPKDMVTDRVVRGGSWLDPLLWSRTYWRSAADPGSRSAFRGFRCARDAR